MSYTARSRIALRLEERRAEAARLRHDGMSIAAIAEQLDTSNRTVHRDLDHMLGDLQDQQTDDTEAHRATLLAELDDLRDRLWQTLDTDPVPRDVAAIAGALTRAIERVAHLWGIEGPPLHVVGHVRTPSRLETMTDDEAHAVFRKLPLVHLAKILQLDQRSLAERRRLAEMLRLDSDTGPRPLEAP